MLNRSQIEAKLRSETRDQIFNRQLADVMAQKEHKRATTEQTYSEKVDWTEYTTKRPTYGQDPVMFTVEDDDKFKTKKWEAMLSDCAFYFDKPTLKEESNMKKTLLTKYDDLFTVAMRPTLQTRKDLLNWACTAQNSYMTTTDAPAEKLIDCTRYQSLLDKYGPDYSTLKSRVGHIRGLFD